MNFFEFLVYLFVHTTPLRVFSHIFFKKTRKFILTGLIFLLSL